MLTLLGASFFMSSLTHAQTMVDNDSLEHFTLEQLLPYNTDLFYQVDTGKSATIQRWMEGTFSTIASKVDSNNSQLETAVLDLLKENTISFAMQMPASHEEGGMGTMYVSANVTLENLQALSDSLKETKTIVSSNYKKTPYYHSEDQYFVLVGDLLVMSNSESSIKQIIDYSSATYTNLMGNPVYLDVISHLNKDRFFSMYINPSFMATSSLRQEDSFLVMNGAAPSFRTVLMNGLTMGLMQETNSEVMGALEGEGFSVTEVSDGFKAEIYVKGNNAKLLSMNIPFNKYNFTPSLYKNISGKNLMLYEEKNDLKNQIRDMGVLLPMTDSDKEGVKTLLAEISGETKIDLEQEVLPLLSGKMATAVHESEQLYPAVTLMAQLELGKRATAEHVLSTLNDYIVSKLDEAQTKTGKTFYTKKQVSLGGTSMYEIAIDMAALIDDAELESLPVENTQLILRMGITSDGLLVISNHPHLEQILRADSGLISDSYFSKAFPSLSNSVAGISYVNMDQVREYLLKLMDMSKETEMRSHIETFLAPWHNVAVTSYASSNTSSTSVDIRVDSKGLEKYGELFSNMMHFGTSTSSEDFPSILPVEDPFTQISCSFHQGMWFYDAVEKLSVNGIGLGKMACTNPSESVTRAEFIESLLSVIQKTAPDFSAKEFDSEKLYFSDIQKGHADGVSIAVNQAASMGLVKGFPDGTFQPHKTLTRAEAVQMMYNAMKVVPGLKSFVEEAEGKLLFDNTSCKKYPCMPPVFKDVHFYPAQDWFYQPSMVFYRESLIKGVQEKDGLYFYPHRTLNRAEAAVIIQRFYDFMENYNHLKEAQAGAVNGLISPSDTPVEIQQSQDSMMMSN